MIRCGIGSEYDGVGNHVAPGLGNIAVSRVAGDGVAVTGMFNV